MSPIPRIGISRPRGFTPAEFLLSREQVEAVDLTEWDVLDLLEVGARTRARIRRMLEGSGHRTILSTAPAYLFRDPDSTSEKITLLEELAEAFCAEAVLLRPGAALEQAPRDWRPPKGLACWRDEGQTPRSQLRPHSSTTAVVDPLWQPLSGRTKHRGPFKLHGWHPSRWIRYYGREQLEVLATTCRRHEPTAVLFAHSMRNEEALTFRRLLARSDEQEHR